MSSRSYSCTKPDCWFCYEMNRIKEPERKWWKPPTSYERRKVAEFKAILETSNDQKSVA